MALNPKILVRTPNWIGDHVMAHPFYLALRKAYPHSEIHFLCSEALASFNDSKFCDKKRVLPTAAKRLGRAFFRTAGEIQSEKFDLAVSLTASVSSALLLKYSRIRIRVGFSQGGSGLFLTDSLRWKGRAAGIHKSKLYLELLNFMTGKVWQWDWVNDSHAAPRKNRIVVAPGASISLRVWPYFKELIEKLAVNYSDYEIAVAGGKSEAQWHSVLGSLRSKNVTDWIEKTTLPEFIDLCRDSSLVIANDSGGAHLAASLAGAPTIVLFGPGDPKYIQPLGAQVHAEVPLSIPCHPCEKPFCHEKYGYQACLKSIPTEKIISKVNSIIPR